MEVFFYIVVVSVLPVLAVSVFKGYRNGLILKRLQSLKSQESDFRIAVSAFRELTSGERYACNRQYQLWKEKYRHLSASLDPSFGQIKTKDPLHQMVVDFASYWHDGRKYINEANKHSYTNRVLVIARFLSEKGIQNNTDQVTAIASDEDNTLLVAGAGTGKTTTILGKLAYLTERLEVRPEEILLLSFTGRAVDELNERIAKKLPGTNVKATTFHSFGLSVIGEAEGEKPDIAFDGAESRVKFLDQRFAALLENPAYFKQVITYFAYYLKPVVLEPGCPYPGRLL